MNKTSRLVLCRDSSLLLVVVAMTFLMAMPSKASKQLVLIAGARQEGIQEFFYQHATNLAISTKSSESLNEWSWPSVRDEDYDLLLRESARRTNKVSRHNIFDLLFQEESNSVIQQVLMNVIRDSWENSTNGIILGEQRFGNVGVDKFTSDDALKIIYRLMENLSITTKDVTLVLIYDTPRIQQWASIWHRESRYEAYSNFLCKSDEDDKRFKFLETTMHPFKLSKVYREHGWNVAILDEKGVRKSGFDPAHAIACDVLGVDCKKGWITGLKAETSRALPSYEINDLDENEKYELEQLFLLRDCIYKHDLKHESGTKEFQIVSQELIWKDCRNDYASEFRENISDVDFFMNAIQSQEGCGREFVDLSDVLAYANSTSFEKLFWSILFSSILFLAMMSGILYVRYERGKNIGNKFDGLFRSISFWRKKSTTPKPPDLTDRRNTICNACKFVRFDPNCMFCKDGKRLSSTEIGKEVERRILQQQAVNIVGMSDEAKNSNELSPSYADNIQAAFGCMPPLTETRKSSSNNVGIDDVRPAISASSRNFGGDTCVNTSHFDMNLRMTKNKTEKRRNKKEKELVQKSKVVKKLKELLVLKNEDGKTVYSIADPGSFSADDNLRIISFEEEDKVFV